MPENPRPAFRRRNCDGEADPSAALGAAVAVGGPAATAAGADTKAATVRQRSWLRGRRRPTPGARARTAAGVGRAARVRAGALPRGSSDLCRSSLAGSFGCGLGSGFLLGLLLRGSRGLGLLLRVDAGVLVLLEGGEVSRQRSDLSVELRGGTLGHLRLLGDLRRSVTVRTRLRSFDCRERALGVGGAYTPTCDADVIRVVPRDPSRASDTVPS